VLKAYATHRLSKPMARKKRIQATFRRRHAELARRLPLQIPILTRLDKAAIEAVPDQDACTRVGAGAGDDGNLGPRAGALEAPDGCCRPQAVEVLHFADGVEVSFTG
jgi:hypothetical protein